MKNNCPLRYHYLVLFICLLGYGLPLLGQASEGGPDVLLEFNQRQQRQQRTAMLVLGGWAVGNIATGALRRGAVTGEDRYFHEMNMYWNGVNLAIAAFGYYSAVKMDPAAMTLFESNQGFQSFGKTLLFNAGLDLGYIAGGFYLQERANRPDVNGDRLRGFGKSIVVQGGFLLAFDLANYYILSRTGKEFLPVLLGPTADGIGMTLVF